MSLILMYTWAVGVTTQSQNLRMQIASALAVAAVQVLNEATNTTNHAARLVWASSILATAKAPLEAANQVIWGVLGNTTIQAELVATGTAVDGDVQFQVDSLVNTYAV